MNTGYKVQDVMTENVYRIDPDSTILICARGMADQKIGSAIVVANDNVVGIITEQDLARKVLAQDLDPKNTLVDAIMTRNPHLIGPDADVYDAMVKMGEKKIKHLPVVRDGSLLGVISVKDIIKIQPDLIEIVSFKSSVARTPEAKEDI